ncbi:alpha/beta hydrolase [Streptomyces sp. ME19-01-6]|uniref:alpha/beta fold hydrolase n=1 Tax=Streptomyces sp. ME19-01-6 TaxID=3028686 RepID=UPI0029A37B2B|nr:alpha/beta hydrolase [Streptomyces sp. ME19-01-6]MDX3233519.1 alpha/beta hydrolase [Streptomyces sp. ME19-01-6]
MNSPAPKAPTAVLVHGYLDDGAIWNSVRAVLDEVSIPSIAFELAGMGERTSDQGPFTLARWADDLESVVSATEGPVVLVGHSMGSQIAELVAARSADQVRSLVLINPIPLAGTHLPPEQIAPFQAPDLELDAQRAFRGSLATAFPAEESDRLAQVALRVAPSTIADTAAAWNNGHPDGQQPSKYRGSVTVLRGENDPFVTEEIVSTYVAPRFPGATTQTIAGAGHWAHAENPAAVAAVIGTVVEASSSADGRPAKAWTSAFEQRTEESFAAALSPNVRMEASALTKPLERKEQVEALMAAVSSLYERLEFVRKVQDGPRTYLEWEASAFGGFAMKGITILTRDDEGLITEIAIHHRPFGAVAQINAKVGGPLIEAGLIPAEYFNFMEGE